MSQMNISIHIGTIKIVAMSTASTVAIGNSGIANRNSSKSNAGPSPIVDGDSYMPMQKQITYDPDQIDASEQTDGHSANHIVAAPTS
ncbi:hypothetical protein ACFQ49_16110 [Kroppenstedtia eburnea]|uniref:Spore germination protein gerPA/gerPF n=1 Tax=Kroppenstedtia eburnea TaxID=714067 RepID=A0A1N7JH53_9BACL|nr:hypothetical protein [Kroppenstedtia eburnea]EGK10181.1 hypothetical protein HMPREF9374_2531 [Desmospora sp. 8437]SGO83653.1 Uncharacterised protein [Mycobacterium tuberculosis]SIS48594.1 hypothetical protein SAMN05421790_10288 [Kroppenstedtia eburnea]